MALHRRRRRQEIARRLYDGQPDEISPREARYNQRRIEADRAATAVEEVDEQGSSGEWEGGIIAEAVPDEDGEPEALAVVEPSCSDSDTEEEAEAEEEKTVSPLGPYISKKDLPDFETSRAARKRLIKEITGDFNRFRTGESAIEHTAAAAEAMVTDLLAHAGSLAAHAQRKTTMRKDHIIAQRILKKNGDSRDWSWLPVNRDGKG